MSSAAVLPDIPGRERRAVSPYARRLARERGLPLLSIVGSGPGGRIVAADVDSFRPPEADPVEAAAPAAVEEPTRPPKLPGVLTTSIDFRALSELLQTFAAAGRSVAHVDVVLRAAALALDANRGGEQSEDCAISLEVTGGGIVLRGAARLAVPAIRALREGATVDAAPEAEVSLKIRVGRGIRSVLLPLKPGSAMRLAVSAEDAGGDCLLVHDADAVDEDRAEAVLAAFRDGLEAPLSLFV
jgi:pyruvate/2-oxoglutarate dehydrogenase complex dihydrolipoamide acyltransferase (E2) component